MFKLETSVGRSLTRSIYVLSDETGDLHIFSMKIGSKREFVNCQMRSCKLKDIQCKILAYIQSLYVLLYNSFFYAAKRV